MVDRWGGRWMRGGIGGLRGMGAMMVCMRCVPCEECGIWRMDRKGLKPDRVDMMMIKKKEE